MRRIGFTLFSLLWIAGCARVGLEVETVVHEDGSLDRSVTYTGDNVEREALAGEYQLPSGPGWKVSEGTQAGSPVFWGSRSRLYVYRAEGTFRTLEADYAKKDFRLPPAFSKNRIVLQQTPEGLVYQETFSDTANRSELRRLGERYVQEAISKIMASLRGSLFSQEDPAMAEVLQRNVTTSVLGYFDQIWHSLEELESKEKSEFVRGLIDQSVEFLTSQINQGWRAQGRHYPQAGGREQVAKALEEASDQIGKDETWAEPYVRDLKRYGGAYLPSWADRSYPFKFSVTMPAPIVESNATQVKGNTATWEFDPLFFLLKDYTLKVRAKPKTEGS